MSTLRKVAERVWLARNTDTSANVTFEALFPEGLGLYDHELVGQMAKRLAADYDALALEILEAPARARPPSIRHAGMSSSPAPAPLPTTAIPPNRQDRRDERPASELLSEPTSASAVRTPTEPEEHRLQAHIVTPAIVRRFGAGRESGFIYHRQSGADAAMGALLGVTRQRQPAADFDAGGYSVGDCGLYGGGQVQKISKVRVSTK